MEKVKPAGVKSDGYFAEISGGVCPPRGILVAIALTAIARQKATILPTQSCADLVIVYYRIFKGRLLIIIAVRFLPTTC
jgi:hypothetical protein